MSRTLVPGKRMVTVECKTCGWKASGANAQGIAAQHADRHAGHDVHVDVHQQMRYVGT